MTPVDLTKILKRSYVGKWVAFTPDMKRVCGVGDTIDEALAQAALKKCDRPVVHKVLPFNQGLAPTAV